MSSERDRVSARDRVCAAVGGTFILVSNPKPLNKHLKKDETHYLYIHQSGPLITYERFPVDYDGLTVPLFRPLYGTKAFLYVLVQSHAGCSPAQTSSTSISHYLTQSFCSTSILPLVIFLSNALCRQQPLCYTQALPGGEHRLACLKIPFLRSAGSAT